MYAKRLKEFIHRYPFIKAAIKAALYPAIVVRKSFNNKKSFWQKEILNNLGDIIIGNPVIRVDEFEGVFTVSPHSHLFYRLILSKCYEPKLVKLCMKYLDKNRDAIDVGANIGFYSVLFAKNLANKKVLSIEPTKNAIQFLRQNIKLNDVTDKVVVFEGVASDKKGVDEIKTIKGKEEYSSLGKMIHPCIEKEKWSLEEVISNTLDNLVQEKSLDPGFLKVDTEGVEHLVFKGAQNVLSEKRPIILSELSDFLLKGNGSSAEEVIDLIKSNGYDLFDPMNPSVQPNGKNSDNIICFPKEMGIRL